MVEALTPPDASPDFCAVSLIVPTLNEARNVERLIDRCYQALSQVTDRFEVIIVDDDSPDETYNLAAALIPRYPGLSVIRRRKPRDLAGSVVDGWAVAKGEWLAVIDGDLQHPPEKLTALLQAAAATGADITVASRHVRGGGVSEWSLLRRIVSWAACLIASLCNFFSNTHVTWSLWYGEDIKMDGSHVQKRRRFFDVLERVYAGRLLTTRLADSLLK